MAAAEPGRSPRNHPRHLRRTLGLALLAVGGLLVALWVGVPLSADAPPPSCQPVEGVLRGVYHLHPLGHDDTRDRSPRALAAARRACLDFVVVTDHHGARAMLYDEAAPDDLLVLDGAEWTRPSGHHHSQLVGAHEPTASSARDAAFRVLNHPASSAIDSVADLTEGELALLGEGQLAVEVHNVTRLLRTPPTRGPFWLALAVGPARSDLFYAALSVPGGSVSFWVGLQRELGRAVPIICGTDAHGGLSDFADLFSAAVLHVPAPPGGALPSRAWVVEQVREGYAVCVNEFLGSPGPLALAAHGERGARVRASLPAEAHWRLVHDGGEAVAQGRDDVLLEDLAAGVYHLEVWREVSFGWLGRRMRLWALTGGVVVAAPADPSEPDPAARER